MPKKNGKLRICVDYWKLNAQTKRDPFPLPFWIQFLIQWPDMKCTQVWMVIAVITKLKWKKKTKKIHNIFLEWGAYAYNVMPFGLCNVFATFQKVVTKTLKEYLNKFMQVFLDDFGHYGSKKDHLCQLQKCLEECR